jgi:hypothetical protein
VVWFDSNKFLKFADWANRSTLYKIWKIEICTLISNSIELVGSLKHVTEKATHHITENVTWYFTEKAILTYHWKAYGWYITEKTTMMVDVSLKRVRWRVIYYWKNYHNISLNSLRVTYHWEDYNDEWCITENAMMMGDVSLKRLPWHITKKPTGDISLKRLP